MDEIASIKSEIQLLTTRLAALELENASKQGTQSGGDPVAFGTDESSPIEIAKLRAFDVICDGLETDPWLVYLPDGCCKYGDFTPDVIDPAPDATTHLADLQNDTKNGGIYAHLYLELDDDSDSDSSTEPEVVGFPLLSIDTTPTQTPSGENIKVIDIKIATITNGAVSQIVSSALMIGGSGGGETYTPNPSPFEFTVVSSEDPKTHEPTIVGQVSNCKFYWDGVLKSISNFTPPANCTVYLCCTQEAPSQSGEAEWQFSIATSPAEAPEKGNVLNYKLYDIASNKVTMDYRTTFLALNTPNNLLTVTGTDAVTVRGKHIIFKSDEHSNVKVTCANDENGAIVATIGVYYV